MIRARFGALLGALRPFVRSLDRSSPGCSRPSGRNLVTEWEWPIKEVTLRWTSSQLRFLFLRPFKRRSRCSSLSSYVLLRFGSPTKLLQLPVPEEHSTDLMYNQYHKRAVRPHLQRASASSPSPHFPPEREFLDLPSSSILRVLAGASMAPTLAS